MNVNTASGDFENFNKPYCDQLTWKLCKKIAQSMDEGTKTKEHSGIAF
ncbi:hypothetical protein AusDCA_2565 [Desulfitobacterium sp. AusDCA]